MKVILTHTTTIELNLEEERNRVRRCFKKKKEAPYRDRLIEVIDIFEKDGYEKALEAFDHLPYNEIDEYSLKESMGKWWYQINGDQFFRYEDNMKHEHSMEIIKH
jgi:hypothetical protein